MLLSRTLVDRNFLGKCRELFLAERDAEVRIAIASILMQRSGRDGRSVLHLLVFHSNEKIRKFGKLLREIRFDPNEARTRLKFIFHPKRSSGISDAIALLFSMTQSDRPEILQMLIRSLAIPTKRDPRLDLRVVLREVERRAKEQLSTLQGAS
jgi:hypothetical protein